MYPGQLILIPRQQIITHFCFYLFYFTSRQLVPQLCFIPPPPGINFPIKAHAQTSKFTVVLQQFSWQTCTGNITHLLLLKCSWQQIIFPEGSLSPCHFFTHWASVSMSKPILNKKNSYCDFMVCSEDVGYFFRGIHNVFSTPHMIQSKNSSYSIF